MADNNQYKRDKAIPGSIPSSVRKAGAEAQTDETNQTEDEGCYLWRVRGPWSDDDWLLASDIPAAEMESRQKCEVSLVYWSDESSPDYSEKRR